MAAQIVKSKIAEMKSSVGLHSKTSIIERHNLAKLTKVQKKERKRAKKNYKAKIYQRERRIEYLKTIEKLKAEKRRLQIQLEQVVEERNKIWQIELELLKNL